MASVESRWRVWRDDERLREAFEAHARASGAQTWSVGRVEAGEVSPVHEEDVRFWWQAPDSLREEREVPDPGHATLAIRVGATWWSWSPPMGAMTNAGDERHGHGAGEQFTAMLDPAAVIGLLDFTITGRGVRAGRPVLLVSSRPRSQGRGDRDMFSLHHLGLGAQEYALEVDSERGVLLRAEARFDGRPTQVTEALQIAVDTPLDPELFRFTPPPGEELHQADMLHRFRHGIPLHEAVAGVPFAVYALADPPPDWELTVTLHAGHERPLAHPSVGLNYRSRDAAAQLNISQLAAATAEDYAPSEGEDVEHAGRQMRVRQRTDSWPQAQLAMTLDDTLIAMNSDSLTAEDLINLATRLTLARRDAPRI
ncbi:MAG: hypothetical protein JWO02_1603 [Solirubrobacterales bacterium]|nr:hypothetical protein [Solirubrobacterales bacterium]